ncbi:ferritin-like domain-containing protein [Tundrisphaera lichenicola]|uniref:ferritin-like domain-containing protein n=1 Tax=Tundrisphaera lichenicola TaxID=2029860 RepID=UPI003EBF120D
MTDESSTLGGTPIDRLFRFRREFLTRILGTGTGVAIAGLAQGNRQAEAQGAAINDPAILNFALNLEYLEAEFYTHGVSGVGIQSFGIGVNGAGIPGGVIIKPSPQVPFQTPAFQQYAAEIANDERNHVVFLRKALAAAGIPPVARPAIDLQNSFNAAAQAAGLGSSFDPFASEDNFLIGSFVFEDVGVTAYLGAARFIKNKDYLEAAGGILAVEAYHAGEIRTLMLARGLSAAAAAISNLRASASGAADDQGILDGNMHANIVPTDGNSLVFKRSAQQVLNIVYLGGSGGGGFFPNGLNGVIR